MDLSNFTLYHYVTADKYAQTIERKLLLPSSPFNSNVPETEWPEYARRFSFPVARLNTCCFFEEDPKSWKEFGLFELLMEEFSGGDYLLKLTVPDQEKNPLLVRDHSFHSPKRYGFLPEEWKKREVRDARPDLREAWYQSATTLRTYKENFMCPEVLIPFPVAREQITVIRKRVKKRIRTAIEKEE